LKAFRISKKIQFWGFEDYQRNGGKEAATNTGSIIRHHPPHPPLKEN
jgi:hypothetical protein